MTQIENKVVKLYKQKQYGFDVGSFLNFIHEKVQLDSFGMDLVKQKIEDFGIEGQFDEEVFRLLLRLITAVQLRSSQVMAMARSQVEQISTSIAFKSRKGKNSQKPIQAQSNNQQMQARQIVSQKQEQVKPTQQNIKKYQPAKIQQPTHQTYAKNQQVNDNVKSQTKTDKKTNEKKDQPKEKKPRKQITYLSSIEQVDNSSQIKLSNLGEDKGPMFLDMTESKQQASKAKITQYEKFSADYMNPVIKYTIVYKNCRVLRRFSQFEKLINILREKYQGFILPKLPPKEGIKAGINYFWGIDQAFLQQRKKKLQQMLNRLLSNKIINEDLILKKFLTDQHFEIQVNKESYASYLKGITDIVFNAKQLKDFGVAYYNYLREKGNVKLDNEIENKYAHISEIIQVFNALDSYRKRINKNFDKRRQIIHELAIKSRNPQNSGLDKLMDLIEEEIQDLNFEMENYKELKSQQSWIVELIKQKQGDGQRTLYQLKQQQDQLQKRLDKIQKNLKFSLEEFYKEKASALQLISSKVVQWREKVHP